ncbi:MAG: NAD-dependent succinate-semialdehyde dehydrogenase [FCB group bacterium]|nr:NAD-dependent succinate-semialdehyde dehydrogenase [FCB group bacterium]
MQSVNPADNRLISETIPMTSAEANEVIELTARAQNRWRLTGFEMRSRNMHRVAELLRSGAEVFAELMTREMGKPIRESRAEVEKCAWVCDYYADNAREMLSDRPVQTDAGKSSIVFEPLGVVLAVMPWNFPFWQVFRFAAPALMAGNGGLLKHASNVSGCAGAIEALFREAGFPEHLFRWLKLTSNQISKVIANAHVKAVTLTGSETAGRSVASAAGDQIKKTVLELGGSDPFIVLRDADIASCTSTAITARFLNTGQSCIAAKRFIVVRDVLDIFTDQILRKTAALQVGNPLDEATDIGPLARPDLVEELHRQVTRSTAQGAKLLLGGKKMKCPGCYYEPTVLTDVRAGMPVYEEEVFGPVLVIIPVEDAKEALAAANDTKFGLGASLWTSDVRSAEKFACEIEAGSVFINGMVKSDPRLPFGGIKWSGYGRELGVYGIREFVNIKTVWIK